MSYIVTIRDEEYVTLATIAECYECSEAWVREIFAVGLLGPGEVLGEMTLVPVTLLDRVAHIRRLSVFYGLEIEVIVQILD
jgi:hypothetical protein